jgi:hypothetical protein
VGEGVKGVEYVDEVEDWREAGELSTSREVTSEVVDEGVADLGGVTDRLDAGGLTGSRVATPGEVTGSVRGWRMTTIRVEGGVTCSPLAIVGVLGVWLPVNEFVANGL